MKKLFTLSFVLCLASVMLGANLIQNGNFETWTDAATAANWKWVDDGGKITDAYPSAVVTAAKGAEGIVVTAPSKTVKLFQQIPVEAGKEYKLSFSYKATGEKFRIWSGFAPEAGKVSGIVFVTVNSADDALRTNNKYFPVASNWTNKEITFTVPAGQTLFHLEYRYYALAGAEFGLKEVVLEDASGSGVAEEVAAQLNLFVSGNVVNFTTEEAVNVGVYSMTGAQIFNKVSTVGANAIKINNAGLYIVKVGTKAIMVRI